MRSWSDTFNVTTLDRFAFFRQFLQIGSVIYATERWLLIFIRVLLFCPTLFWNEITITHSFSYQANWCKLMTPFKMKTSRMHTRFNLGYVILTDMLSISLKKISLIVAQYFFKIKISTVQCILCGLI